MIDLTLGVSIPHSALRSDELPFGARILLVSSSLTILTAFFLSLTMLAVLIRWMVGGVASIRPLATWTIRIFKVIVTFLLFFVYAASWGLFWQTGSFIDSQQFIFLAPHPLQVFHWVDLDVASIVLACAAVGTVAVLHWIPTWMGKRPESMHKKLLRTWRRAILVCLMGTLLGYYYSAGEHRQNTRATIVYARKQANSTSPFTYVLADLKRNLAGSEELSTHGGFEIHPRAILSLDRYRAIASQSHPKRWNVVFLIVESLRADQLRAYGASRVVMPAAETLATESKIFLNAYTQSSHTNYATIVPLSSHYPLRSASAYTYPKTPTYPRVLIYDLLKAMRYKTAFFSSSNENWGGMVNYLDTGGLDRFVHAANSKRSTYVNHGDAGFAAWVRETKHAGSLDDRVTVDEAIEWLGGVGDQPFFLALNFQNSHVPYPIPPDFPRRFGPPKLDFAIRFAQFPRNKIEVVKNVYADSLAYVDAQLERLIQYLKMAKKWENTLVVLTGDHGQAFYEHGFAAHASAIYDEVMRVPLLIRAPEIQAGTDNTLAQHVDIAPTVLGLLGLPPHPSFQGLDLFAAPANPNRSVYMVAQTPDAYQYGIIRSGHKLIYDERLRQHLLFDLRSDPGEERDLTASNPELVADLTARLNAWRKLQVDYYSDSVLHKREYPPILKD